MTIHARSQIVVERNDDQEDSICRRRERGWHRAENAKKDSFLLILLYEEEKGQGKNAQKKESLQLPHKKSFFTKRTKMPKNALSLRPTAAAAALLSAAALFCVVELACARETQYFYNSVTGEVLLRVLLLFFRESNFFFVSLDPVSSFCDRMIARLESFLSGSLSSVVVVSPRRTTTKRDTKTTTREEVFSDFLCVTSHSNITLYFIYY